MPLDPDLRRALVDGLSALYGARLRRVVLFGSEARGDARPDSDVDVLVVLAGEVDRAAEAWALSALVLDLLDGFGRYVAFVVMREGELDADWPFHRNVRAEGVALLEPAAEAAP